MRSLLSRSSPNLPLTTGIGSLPHTHVESALDYAFQFKLPFLPQLPLRDSREWLIPQNPGGTLRPDDLMPPQPLYSCWEPFLKRLQERQCPYAKVQIVGPFTLAATESNWDGKRLQAMGQLVSARSTAMVREILEMGVQPVIYLDEPRLPSDSAWNTQTPTIFEELKKLVSTLRQEGAIVGLHCCGKPSWNEVIELDVDVLSLDVTQGEVHVPALQQFIEQGGVLSLGVIPTDVTSAELLAFDVKAGLEWAFKLFAHPAHLSSVILTPACGLALRSISEADLIFEKLKETYECFSRNISDYPRSSMRT